MQLTTYPGAGEFLSVAEVPLAKDEARNNLILGIAARVRDGHSYGDDPPVFLTIDDDGDLIVAAIRTPPYPLILHGNDVQPAAIELLVKHLRETVPQLPGINGEPKTAEAFAARWTQTTETQARIAMKMRIYCLRETHPPTGIPGTMRLAQQEDLALLTEWMQRFHAEAVPNDPSPDARKTVLRFLDAGTLAVWDNEGPVSMVGSSRGTAHGAAISAVYTPPEKRGNGYASAAVATLSRQLLDQGYLFCVLYADLLNPTSNKIYQRIGFRAVCDAVQYRFEPIGEGNS